MRLRLTMLVRRTSKSEEQVVAQKEKAEREIQRAQERLRNIDVELRTVQRR